MKKQQAVELNIVDEPCVSIFLHVGLMYWTAPWSDKENNHSFLLF